LAAARILSGTDCPELAEVTIAAAMFRTANGVLSRSATARAPESLRFSPMAIRALATAIDDLLLPANQLPSYLGQVA
jgi:hypothetical protein